METMIVDEKKEKAQKEYQQILQQFQTVHMATATEDGTPNASYAPFVRDEYGNFYVFLSGLSQHTKNMVKTGKVSLLLIEDEGSSTQVFARKRLTFSCKSILIERNAKEFENITSIFENKFGSIFQHLKPMPDFNLFQLVPSEGLLVIGFGQAFQIRGKNLDEFHHLGGDGGHNTARKLA